MKLHTTATIYRIEESVAGTFGTMTICGQAFCQTLELPDRLNEIDVSNIPPGQYICEKIISAKFGETFEVKSIPGRSMVLFHAGNFLRETRGCVILGQYFDKLKGERAILNSGKTFKKFMSIMADVDKFHLTIKECY